MKLSHEERTALKTGISKFKTLFTFVLLSQIIYPQIPFKGFCKLNSFNVDSGFTKIFSLNYNHNEHSDLLIFNPLQKEAALYNGKSGTEFILKDKLTLPLEISSIEPIIIPQRKIETFAFTSRKNRSFGIYNFNTSGQIKLVSQIKLDSYPENVSVTNKLSGDYQIFLLSGNPFDGLSIISNENKKLEEKKIYSGKVFQNAQFIDFNSDGYEDIAALNSVENKLHFLYNNSRDEFSELKVFNIDDDVLSMRIFDINYDGFKDIIVSTRSKIIIYFGDAYSSFVKTISVQTKFPADKFVIGDFNRDGFFDINYLNADEGIVSTIFAKDFNEFYPEIIHLRKEGIVDIIPFFSKFVYGAAYVNQNGEVSILSQVTSMSDDQKLAIAVEPDLITLFEHTNNGIKDLLITDKFDRKIKFIIRSSAGLPDKYYETSLYEEPDKILTFNNSKSKKTFFFYSSYKNVIEAIEIDFDKYSFNRKVHYAEGSILDFKVIPNSAGDAELYLLYSKNKVLNLQIISKTQHGFDHTLFTDLSSNWFNSFLFFDNRFTIGYWQYDEGFLKLNFINIVDNEKKSSTKIKLSNRNFVLLSKSNSNPATDINEFKYFALLRNERETFAAAGNKEPKLYSITNLKKEFRIEEKNQLFFDKSNSVFLYDPNLSSLAEIYPAKNSGNLIMSAKTSGINLNNYFIHNSDQKKSFLIFTDTNSGCIELRQLSK